MIVLIPQCVGYWLPQNDALRLRWSADPHVTIMATRAELPLTSNWSDEIMSRSKRSMDAP